PNFRFVAQDLDGHLYDCICYASSETELRDRLARENLVGVKVEPYHFWKWLRRAAKARRKAIEAHRANRRLIKFNDALWGELKFHLCELFHGKCAYCESRVRASYGGDVEHYRPKGKVDEDNSHPGYYWLAYNPSNLLPSCALCNQARGKMTHFPIAPDGT